MDSDFNPIFTPKSQVDGGFPVEKEASSAGEILQKLAEKSEPVMQEAVLDVEATLVHGEEVIDVSATIAQATGEIEAQPELLKSQEGVQQSTLPTIALANTPEARSPDGARQASKTICQYLSDAFTKLVGSGPSMKVDAIKASFSQIRASIGLLPGLNMISSSANKVFAQVQGMLKSSSTEKISYKFKVSGEPPATEKAKVKSVGVTAGDTLVETLEGTSRLSKFLDSTSPRVQNLAKAFAGFLKDMGATSEATVKFRCTNHGEPYELPTIKDLSTLADDEVITVMSDGKNSVAYTGKEIKQMAQSAEVWTAGERGKPFTDPGLSTGITQQNSYAMMKAMTWSETPRPMADISGQLVSRSPDAPGASHFTCNASAPDMLDPHVKKQFLSDSDLHELEEAKKSWPKEHEKSREKEFISQKSVDQAKMEAFITSIVTDFVNKAGENGVEAVNIGAIGLGVFAGKMNDTEKMAYAQMLVDAAKTAVEGNPSIKKVLLVGREFENASLSGFPEGVGVVQTNHELTTVELAEGKSNVRSASLNAGDQNKLPGFQAWGKAKSMLEGGHFAGDPKQDEMTQLRNPLFGVLQNPIYNSYLRNLVEASMKLSPAEFNALATQLTEVEQNQANNLLSSLTTKNTSLFGGNAIVSGDPKVVQADLEVQSRNYKLEIVKSTLHPELGDDVQALVTTSSLFTRMASLYLELVTQGKQLSPDRRAEIRNELAEVKKEHGELKEDSFKSPEATFCYLSLGMVVGRIQKEMG